MKKHIVIVGGMGPQASLDLHKRILDEAAKAGAKHAHEFPQITHLSLPIEDIISDVSGKDKALELINNALSRFYISFKRKDCYSLQYFPCNNSTIGN